MRMGRETEGQGRRGREGGEEEKGEGKGEERMRQEGRGRLLWSVWWGPTVDTHL